MNKLKQKARTLWKSEDGAGTLEIILIIAVIVVVAIIFRKWILTWIHKLLDGSAQNLNDGDFLNDLTNSPAPSPSE
ncbi:MAG TPA: Flp1 family type IVb pilin [Bacilli bacterium]